MESGNVQTVDLATIEQLFLKSEACIIFAQLFFSSVSKLFVGRYCIFTDF